MIAVARIPPAPELQRPSVQPLSQPLAELLRELAGVVSQLSASQYTERCGLAFSNGAIGGHVRHCLDHIRALLDGYSAGIVDYDHRARGTNIETDPNSARDEIRRLRRIADDLAVVSADTPLQVAVIPTRDGASLELRSTLGRELSFVLSHTIHHNAMIKGMALHLGIALPSAFGYAPSTLAHLESTEQECAQ